jgi:CARDB
VDGCVVSTRDEDILDFDFFDEEEPPTWEDPADRGGAPPRERGPRGRPPGGRGPRLPSPPSNLTPLLRLVALIALGILVVVLLAVWVEGCTSDAKSERYNNYLTEIGAVGSASARLGREFANQVTAVGLNREQLDRRLGGFIQTAESQVATAEAIDPPGPLVRANEGAIEALRYRANGLRALGTAFQETTADTEASAAGEALSVPVQRLLASDVIWQDSFAARATVVLQEESIEGQVPASEFVATDELTTPSALAAIWQRITNASTGGTPTGLRGTGLSSVKVLPGGQVLSVNTETTIEVTDQLGFEVAVENTGDSQELRIQVTLTIPKDTQPVVRRATIPIIDPGQVKTVTFSGLGGAVPFDQTTVKVDIDPVLGETNPANNTAEYPVIFTL